MNINLILGALFREAFPPDPVFCFWLQHNLRPPLKKKGKRRGR